MSKSIKNRKLIFQEMLKTINPKDVADDGSPNLPEQFLTGLLGLFGFTAKKALDLLRRSDGAQIFLLADDDNFQVFRVRSTSGNVYYVYHKTFFCTCYQFQQSVLQGNIDTVCKHIIATRLAEALGIVTRRLEPREFITEIHNSMVEFVTIPGVDLDNYLTSKFSNPNMTVREWLEPYMPQFRGCPSSIVPTCSGEDKSIGHLRQ